MRPREFLPRDFFDLPAAGDDHAFDLPAAGDDHAIIGRGPNILLRDRARLLADRRLNQTVGERQPNEPDDVAQVQTFVQTTGDLRWPDREPSGLFSAPLRDAILGFQRRNRLNDDGIVTPDGPTFDALRREIDFDEDRGSFGRTGIGTTEPDGTTQLGLRCRRIAVRLGNLGFELDRIEQLVEQDRRALESALERMRNAEVADARVKADIALGVASIGASLAARNFLAAAVEAGALALSFIDSRTELGEAAQALEGAATRLAGSAAELNEKRNEIAELEAERNRLGCSSIGF